jgi:hypothetical protein
MVKISSVRDPNISSVRDPDISDRQGVREYLCDFAHISGQVVDLAAICCQVIFTALDGVSHRISGWKFQQERPHLGKCHGQSSTRVFRQ